MKAGDRLKIVVRSRHPDLREALEAAGIDRISIRRAALGQAIDASVHLQLCAMLGIDPVTGDAAAPRSIGPLHRPSLAMAVRVKRMELNLTLRPAAQVVGISYSVLYRIEAADTKASVDSIIAACRWIGRHPYDFVSPAVKRETSRETQTAGVAA